MFTEQLPINNVKDAELSFEKRTVTELTEADMATIDGGTTPTCVITLIVTLTLIPHDAN